MEVLVSNIDGHTETYSRPDGVTASNPALEAKHVLGIDAEFGDFSLVGGQGNKVLGDISPCLPSSPRTRSWQSWHWLQFLLW